MHHLEHRAKAKRQESKVGESSTNPDIPESEDQTLVTPEANVENPKDHHEDQGDPPPQTELKASEAMDTDANPAGNLNPLSPILASSPAKATEDIPSYEKKNKDITITGAAYKTPETSNVLTKHISKEETPSFEKGKVKI